MQSDKESLIEFLISKGEIPSFSFPLDTTMFAAEQKTAKGVSHVARYSRDTKLALSELAPGQLRTVDGKKMEIGGLYFEYSRDRVNRAKEFFDEFFRLQENRVSMCLNDFCGWISQDKRNDLTNTDCPVCSLSEDPSRPKDNVRTYRMLQPEGLAPICVPHDNGQPRLNMSTKKATTLVKPVYVKQVTKNTTKFSGRARLPAPEINDLSRGEPAWTGSNQWKSVSLYTSTHDEEGLGTEFVLINTGPGENGFTFCENCGASMHPQHIKKVAGPNSEMKHFRPYIVQNQHINMTTTRGENDSIHRGCSGNEIPGDLDLPIGLGLRFRTDLILFRFNFEINPFNFDWFTSRFHGAISAMRDSIQTIVAKKLGLMNREIGAGYRLVVDESHRKSVDIYLYDSVSGGAGLVTQVCNHLDDIIEILDQSMQHLDGRSCLEKKPCSRACVGCLLDFKNKFDHSIINRPLGWSLLRYFRDGRKPSGRDLGISNGVPLNRIQNAVSAYSTFLGDDNSMHVSEDDVVAISSENQWKIVSPLIKDDYTEKIMRVDTFEFFPDIIIQNFQNQDIRRSVFDF